METSQGQSIYEAIYNQYKHLILSNAMAEDEKLPSVRTLAMQLSVNPNTVQRAYTMLENEGLVYVVKGCGNFVAKESAIDQIKRVVIGEKAERLVTEAKSFGIEKEEVIQMIRKSKPKLTNSEADKSETSNFQEGGDLSD